VKDTHADERTGAGPEKGPPAPGVLVGAEGVELVEQVARIVHELRSPLAGAAQAVAFIDSRRDEPPDPTLLGVARRQLDVGLRRVEQLLMLLRGDAGRTHIAPVPRQLRTLVREVAEEHLTLDRDLLQIDVDPRLWVHVDPAAFVHVLENLVRNATRYAPEGTPVSVSAEARDARVLLRVSDEGPGIDPEVFDQVFEPFARGSGGGAGLGLTIVRHLVEAHGGEVWIEIDPNARGTSLVVALPSAETPEE
jgi:signal transduction histidine kinase